MPHKGTDLAIERGQRNHKTICREINIYIELPWKIVLENQGTTKMH